MRNTTTNNIKLGLFTLAGLAFLVLLLYVIGRNQSLFGHTFELRAQFDHARGLKPGHNVRYAGIQVGTVKRVSILNDTLMEVLMLVDDDMRNIIRTNAVADIGSDGLMGSHILNISPGEGNAPFVQPGAILPTRRSPDTDEMLRTLDITNQNVALISEELKQTVERINQSAALWRILNDEQLPTQLSQAVINLQRTTAEAQTTISDIHQVVAGVKAGKGSLGAVLTDTAFAVNLNEALLRIKGVGSQADTLAASLNQLTRYISTEVNNGQGMVHAVLKDSSMVNQLQQSLHNLQQGTERFNQNMEALKRNFFFRRYFREKDRKQR
ncbi:MAG TPA: MlaD family protein [Lacibacter sp.]|nr:MlaD family protein [Lacibacter sp.]HMO89915.1 MlaD family protein [Lacibacter sp.]HMP86312.1 MlaD family protein [Lacibacter sp.]